jgi:flagellin
LATDDAATASASIAAAIQGNAALANLSVTDNADGTVDVRDSTGADISVVFTNGTDTTSNNAVSVDELDASGTASGVPEALTTGQGSVITGDISFSVTDASLSYALFSSNGSGNITSATTSGAGGGSVTVSSTRVSDVDITSVSGANDALEIVDAALTQLDSQRADLGAVQNRFESVIANLSNVSENSAAARSRIRDADFAAETAELARAQILQQAGISVLAQANAQPQNVLALLQ